MLLKRLPQVLGRFFSHFLKDFFLFVAFFFSYLKSKALISSRSFEKQKNYLVKFFLMKRGRYNRPFLHLATMGVLGFGVVIAPYIADTFPIFSNTTALNTAYANAQAESITIGDDVFETRESKKPRDKTIIYVVEKGDTIETIAKKFSARDNPISADTIRWANDLSGDDITIGDELKILPVSGISHKVERGDTVYTIAEKFDTNPQAIVDFPFNDFANPETFALVEGQMLMVPGGVKPEEQKEAPRQYYFAQGPATIVAPGGFTWPVQGGISQFASWYHMALDITDPLGTPIFSAQNGTVTSVSIGSWDGGYGNNVWIDNGAGVATHYAHMNAITVSVGQQVAAGRTQIGTVGLTGRTTGAHLHFEVRQGGVLVNPLNVLQ